MRAQAGLVVFVVAFVSGCGDTLDLDAAREPPVEQAQSAITSQELALAFAWAPIHYQDISPDGDHSLSGRADFVVALNYDGDFDSRNNWDNLGAGFPLYGQAYTAVSESTSHFFIYYTFFHPRSWSNNLVIGDEHENDMEGLVMLVRKDGSQFGQLEAVVTTNHTNWKTYTAAANVGRGPQNPDTPETITTEAWGLRPHPMTTQEYEGHGLKGCTSTNNCALGSTNDVVKYQPFDPSAPLQAPPVPVPGAITPVGYRLLDLAAIFARRFDKPTFDSPGALIGNDSGGCGGGPISCGNNKAVAVWAYEPSYSSQAGAYGTGEDPAALFSALFSFSGGLTPPSNNYLSNKLLHQKCDPAPNQPRLRRMKGSADPCAQQICTVDPYCCNTAWDAICSGRVATTCGKTCSNCGANICQQQSGPIGTGCDGQCAASICARDSYCCSTRWDSRCVAEVASVCGLSCSGLM
jgi:hypothetical protein